MPKAVEKGVCMSMSEYNKLKKKASVSGTKRKAAPKKKKAAKKR